MRDVLQLPHFPRFPLPHRWLHILLLLVLSLQLDGLPLGRGLLLLPLYFCVFRGLRGFRLGARARLLDALGEVIIRLRLLADDRL